MNNEQLNASRPAPIQSAELAEAALRDAVAVSLSGNYYCSRVWYAWGVGTMSEDDFTPTEEVDECIDQVMDAVRPFLAAPAIPAQQQASTAIPDNQAGTWLNDEQVLAVDQAMRLSIACGNDSLSERLSDIIGDRNLTKATKYPPQQQQVSTEQQLHEFVTEYYKDGRKIRLPQQQQAKPTDLHAAIMNLPCNGFDHAYKEGHRDARHAAAELVAASEAQERAVSVPAGWKMVPCEPDDAMQTAGALSVRMDTTALNRIWTGNAVYRAMLEVAPTPPAAPQARELTPELIFDIAAPFFTWNADGWSEATEGVIGMPSLLEFARVIERHFTAPHGESETKPAGSV